MAQSSERTKLLLVEDDLKLAALVKEFLEKEGFIVDVEGRGDVGVKRILAEQPQLVLLDVMLPGLDGFAVCKQVRSEYRGPILMMTARGEEIDEVLGLEIGADDYLSKPVRPRILLSRIRALLRRVSEASVVVSAAVITLGELQIDPGNRIVRLHGDEVTLTSAEFDLLLFLAQRTGEVVTRDQIFEHVRGIEYDGLDRSVDLRIVRLRKKLGDDGKQPRLIKSIRGMGYLLVSQA